MKRLTCNICQSFNFNVLSPDDFRYVICCDCGHVYQRQTKEDHFYHSLQCSFPPDYEEHAKRRAAYILDFVNAVHDIPIFKVLDVGCGPGAVMKEFEELLHKRYLTATCFGCTLHKENENPFIYKLDVERDPLPTGKFDLIMLTHVMEHFLQPVETMRKVAKSLSDEGIVYIETPSFDWGEVRLKTILTPEHLSYYTKTSILNTVGLAGLTPIKIKESHYWGNIKLICRKSDDKPFCIKKVDYRRVLRYHKGVKLLYPWFRMMKRIKKIGPNE